MSFCCFIKDKKRTESLSGGGSTVTDSYRIYLYSTLVFKKKLEKEFRGPGSQRWRPCLKEALIDQGYFNLFSALREKSGSDRQEKNWIWIRLSKNNSGPDKIHLLIIFFRNISKLIDKFSQWARKVGFKRNFKFLNSPSCIQGH